LWLALFFSFSGYTLKLLVDNVNDYLEHNVTTSIDMAYNPSVILIKLFFHLTAKN
jgi:hypothetical protein